MPNHTYEAKKGLVPNRYKIPKVVYLLQWLHSVYKMLKNVTKVLKKQDISIQNEIYGFFNDARPKMPFAKVFSIFNKTIES